MNEKLKGNTNAAKPADERSESHIHARCKTADKAAWVSAAKARDMKLTDWIVKTLNAEIKR